MELFDELLGHAGPGAAGDLLARLHPGPRRTSLSNLAAIGRLAGAVLADEPVASSPGELGRLNGPGFAKLAAQAVLAAVRSSQRLDAAELDSLAAGLDATDLPADRRDLLQDGLRRPPMLDHLTRGIQTRAETVGLYAASLLGADTANELSRHYLAMLAARLGLEQALTDRIEAGLGRPV